MRFRSSYVFHKTKKEEEEEVVVVVVVVETEDIVLPRTISLPDFWRICGHRQL